MPRAFRVVILLACGGLALRAQSWDLLRGLGPGDKIKVVDTSHREHKGAFTAFAERGISFEAGKGVVEIERARVDRVQIRAASRRARNILIGAGIGLAVGVAVDQSAGRYLRNETGENGGARAVTYIAPIALFAGIGAALSPYRTIYRAR
jgi:hypothetical protein